MRPLLVFLIMLGSIGPAYSQLLIGNSASFLSTAGDHADKYDAGFGVGFNAELKLFGQLAVTGEFAWNRWTANGDYPGDLSDANSYNLLVGGKLGLYPLYLETRVGRYLGDFEEFAVIPAAGLRLGKLDLNAGYQISSGFNFFNFRLTYYWFGK